MSNKLIAGGVAAAVLAVLAIILSPLYVVWSIDAGHVGIVSNRGQISESTLPAGGPYLVKPWSTVYRVSVQPQKNEEPGNVPTKGGLNVHVKSVLLYRIDPARVPEVYREFADKYEERFVDPTFKNIVRDACGEYEPEALYTVARTEVEAKVLQRVTAELGKRGFVVEAVMIQEPTLPDVVRQRIEAKVGAEQDALRMAFVFKQREQEGLANKRQKELEAEAKVIEAQGIQKAQAIIQKDLTREYLVYLWIQALKENHGATVYVPTGSDGMPFFKELQPQGAKK